MTRTGQRRAYSAARDHRVVALAAAFMLLLTLAASLLVSAGSPHHQPGARAAAAGAFAATVVAGVDATGAQPAAHEHHYPNEWTPTLSKRVRPAATVALLGILPPGEVAVARAPRRELVLAPTASGDELSATGVLRV